jgi:hypothetical protein
VHLVPKRRKKLIDFLVLLHRCRQGAVGRGKSMDAREEGVGKRMLEKKDRLACMFSSWLRAAVVTLCLASSYSGAAAVAAAVRRRQRVAGCAAGTVARCVVAVARRMRHGVARGGRSGGRDGGE